MTIDIYPELDRDADEWLSRVLDAPAEDQDRVVDLGDDDRRDES